MVRNQVVIAGGTGIVKKRHRMLGQRRRTDQLRARLETPKRDNMSENGDRRGVHQDQNND